MQHEHVFAAHIFVNRDEDLHIGEAPNLGAGQRHVEIIADGCGKGSVGIAREQFHGPFDPRGVWALLKALLGNQTSIIADKRRP